MCRSARGKLVVVCCVMLVITCGATAQETVEEAVAAQARQRDSATAVTAWLERHGLTELLATHLEQQIDETTGEQQRSLIMRLAGLYAELLEATDDEQQRELLEIRARRLLAMTDADGAEELRLSLLRTSYRTAERVGEQYRLRLASTQELDRAQGILADVVPQLRQLNQQLERSFIAMDRQLSRASSGAAGTISSRVERLRQLHQQCSFLTAWALYHDAWLNSNVESARAAEEAFARLLLTDSPRPHPSQVSIDLRATEPYARAILGMALSRSLTASSATALSWIELLEEPNTFAALREQVVVWKIVIHLDHGEYAQVNRLIGARIDGGDALPLMWLRLVAVHALEASGRAPGASQLVRMAVMQLAARGELDQILDLAERYGTDALGQSGFALRYVNGVIAYRHARDAHQQDGPAVDEDHLALYQQAVEHLSAALDESDADQYDTAVGSCLRLKAWALYFQGRFEDAHQAFGQAESRLPEAERAEALWMAIVSLDELIRAGGGGQVQTKQGALVQRFLKDYPHSQRAPTLRLRLAMSLERLDDATLSRLMGVPASHPSYESASRRAAQELYQRYRELPSADRAAVARAYLDVAANLLERAIEGEAAVERLVLDIRRVLEVALNSGESYAVTARRAIARYEQLVAEGHIDDDLHADEIALRTLQERLLDGDVTSASTIADRLWSTDPASVWSRMAARAMFQFVHALRPADDPGRLQLVARYGGRVIREFEDDPRALQQSQVLGYHAAVADALATLWEIDGQDHHAAAALFLYQRMLEAAPHNAAFLRSAASLASHLGELEFASDCWRRIAAGSRTATEPWYEARYELISLLARIDPERALQVMHQHVQLYPDYGPEPWGSRLRQLAQQLESGGAAQGGGS